jgi:hypothetical protein
MYAATVTIIDAVTIATGIPSSGDIYRLISETSSLSLTDGVRISMYIAFLKISI